MSAPEIQVAFETPMQLGECPLWHAAESALYWIDIPDMAVHRLHEASKEHRSWPMPGEPGCIAIHADGGLLVALRGGLVRLNTDTGEMTPLLDAPYDTGKLRFNDGRCDAMGRFWAGTIYEPRDRELGSLFCFDRGELRDAGHPVTTSNGVAFSVDQRTMYHANTPAHRINAYDFDLAVGKTSNMRLFKQFNADKTAPDYGGRPDGAAVDSENAYWCAMFEGGRVLRLSATGGILQEIKLPVRCPTMLAFGGADLKTLYITTGRNGRSPAEIEHCPLSGCVLSVRVDVAGQLEYAYRS
ncbi:SMP-30/gluconolactonase/LRE family protein [Herbaspirillum sp. RV1423]|uniref:SMP-30/gluconolactonase/LRE family protein n=1 Tax=Herbaspirillum sp. RV1423 TaxID=1443993 RepID=UPI0004BAB3D1|nr:SMP-30/gluconolactonase/LRE family protein [Herbaspirillum sp. RV1423]